MKEAFMTTKWPMQIALLLNSLSHRPCTEKGNLTRLRLYLQGYNFAEIAKLEGVTPNPVRYSILPLLTPALTRRHLAQRQKRLENELLAQIKLYRGAIIILVLAGKTNADITNSLGITRNLLKKILATLEPGVMVKRQSALKKHKCKYTFHQKIAALLEAAALNQGKIGKTRFNQLRATHPHWPSAQLYEVEGWNWWLDQAGLPTTPKPKGFGENTFTESDYRRATNRVGAIFARAYTKSEYDQKRLPAEPTSRAIAKRFGSGSWSPALEFLSPHLFKNASQSPIEHTP